MEKARVVQWTTGKVGKLALRGVLDDPRLELAGVYAYSAEKAGKDAGALCGRPDTGVTSTNDIDKLVALKPDTVLYTPFMADVAHAVRLLESGADVISTNLFLNVGGIQGDVKQQLEAACQRGKSRLYITGISPGWINSTIVGLTAICRDVQSVSIFETADCSVYESAETWQAMGMSLPEASPEVVATARMWMSSFYDAVQRMAVALGLELDDVEFVCEFAKTSKKIDLGWFTMEAGTNGAVRCGWNGKIKGEIALQYIATWYLTKELQEGWAFDDEQYHLVIKGEPDIDARMKFIAPKHWTNHDWDTMTAMPAVSAIFDVKRCAPGILTLKDVGLVTAPAGVWRQARN